MNEKFRLPLYSIREINNHFTFQSVFTNGEKYYIESDGGNVLEIEIGTTDNGIIYTDLQYLEDEDLHKYKEIRNNREFRLKSILKKSDKW